MTYSSFWFGKESDTPLPPAPIDIGNSLRFRGDQRLTSNTAVRPPGNFTLSVWVKGAWMNAYNDNNSIYGNGGSTTGYKISNPDSPGNRLGCRDGTSLNAFNSNSFLVDPSAWYNFIIQNNNEQSTAFVNGVEQPNVINTFPATGQLVIGSGNPGSQDENFHGYMTDFYVIDGQVLPPSSFGKYDDNNKWIPIEYEGNYGNNGFHLTFQPDSITENTDGTITVADMSGLGNNFTGFGFDTAPVGIFSGDITTNSTFSAVGGPTTIFDGNTGVFCDATGAGAPAGQEATVTWAPSTPITGLTSLFVFKNVNAYSAIFNGVTTSLPNASGWAEIPLNGATEISAATPLTIRRDELTASLAISAFGINGQTALVDSTGANYDLMVDSPTQNYATLNPSEPTSQSGATYGNANLTAKNTSQTDANVFPCTQVLTGKKYWECTAINADNGSLYFGITPINSIDNTQVSPAWFSTNTFYYNGDPVASNAVRNFGTTASCNFGGITDGDVISFAYDADTKQVIIKKNGDEATASTFTLDTTDPELTPMIVTSVGYEGAINLGQQPFLYTPPEGFTNLQTQTQPTLTVTEGFNGFRAVEAPGAGILPVGQGKANGANGATGFPSGMLMIKDTANANQWQILDSVRGGNMAIQSPSLDAAAAYVPPTGTSVSYCWNTPSTTTTNTDGTIQSTVSANPTTGFSIISFTGNATAGATVGHGLNAAPVFFLLKEPTTNNSQIYTYSEAEVGNGSAIFLNSASAAIPDNIQYWNNTSPNASVITLGFASTTNSPNGAVIYAWTPIPGYSAIGGYTGNGSADGPFIYTGMTSAFVMIKRTDSNGDWYVWDSTRDTGNPCYQHLIPDATNPQNTNPGTANQIDILSNGFKLLSNGGNTNASGGTYVYMAFASNPFGGANVEPANAALTLPNIPGVPDLNSDGNSLRFRAQSYSSGSYLYKTGWADSGNVWTFSCWVKGWLPWSYTTAQQLAPIFSWHTNATSTTVDELIIFGNYPANGRNEIYQLMEGSNGGNEVSNQEFNDPAAWYHIVWKSSSVADVDVYVNGVQVTDWRTSSGAFTSQNFVNKNSTCSIGARAPGNTSPSNAQYCSQGYMAAVYFIDGQSLDPTDFARYDDNGVWIPLTDEESFEKIGGTTGFGPNGFFLDMEPTSVENGDTTIMKDLSGNGNDFTMTGFNVIDPTSSTYDFMVDGPGQNFATLDPLPPYQASVIPVLSGANLNNKQSFSNNCNFAVGTVGVTSDSTDLFYCESTRHDSGEYGFVISSIDGTVPSLGGIPGGGQNSIGFFATGSTAGQEMITANGVNVNGGLGITTNVGDTYSVAIKGNDVWYAINGQWFINDGSSFSLGDFNLSTPTVANWTFTGEVAPGCAGDQSGSNPLGASINFGQQPFKYTPPAGYKTFEVDNLPAVTVTDGSDGFRALEAPGGAILPVAQGLNNDMYGSTGFTTGLWWIKDTANANQWQFLSSATGTQALNSPTTNGVGLTSYIAPTGTSIAYCWQTPSAGTSNLDGTIASTTYANTTTGVSVVEYTGVTGGTSVGHGLSTAPDFVVTWPTDASLGYSNLNGVVYTSPTGVNQFLNMTNGNGAGASTNYWGTAVNDTVFGVKDSGDANNNLNGMPTVAYCFASVPGYSSIGSYTGNGNVDGPFIYTGFTPAFVMVKANSTSGNWVIMDSTMNPNNVVHNRLVPNTANSEGTSTSMSENFLSNGFKMVNSDADLNSNNVEYVYMAFASVPFGGSNVNEAPAALTRPQATPKAPGPLETVSNSLRFRGAQELERTFATAGDQNRWTYSCWIKRGDVVSAMTVGLSTQAASYGQEANLEFNAGGNLIAYGSSNGTSWTTFLQSTQVFRDPSAWYHLMAVLDTDQASSDDRWKWYVNGTQITSFSIYTLPAQGTNNYTNSAQSHTIGSRSNDTLEFDGYMGAVYFIDGLAISPDKFGGYDANGNWVPREYNGAYGTNGFNLTFAANTISGTTIQDQSGNGNDFTMNGFETTTTTSSDYDLMADGPSQNFATLNPQDVTGPAYQPVTINANLAANTSVSQADWAATGTVEIESKVYFEATYTTYCSVGIALSNVGTNSRVYLVAQTGQAGTQGDFSDTGPTDVGLTGQASGTVGVRVDPVARTIAWTFDGSTYSSDVTYTAQDKPIVPYLSAGVAQPSNTPLSINFGQQSFQYTPPTGFSALQTQNLPAATIPNGTEGFRPVLAPGNSVLSVAQADSKNPDGYTGLQGPAMWWIKDIVNANQWQILDSVRGANNALTTPAKGPQAPFTTPVGTSISYCWREDPTLGFDILTWTGTGVSKTISHNLDQTKPLDAVLVKTYAAGTGATYINDANWIWWSNALQDSGFMYWNTPGASSTATTFFNGNPNATLGSLTVGTDADTNANPAIYGATYEYVGYVFQSVPGFSSIGTYKGNGSADGPFIYTGFTPSFVYLKRTDSSGDWQVRDSTRNEFNPVSYQLYTNQTNAQYTGAGTEVEFLSNGFKIACEDTAANGTSMLYMAFASNPFGGSNVNPTNAALSRVPVVQYDEGNYEVSGSALTVGTAFTHNGIQYPANWRDILSHEYLTSIGATWTLS